MKTRVPFRCKNPKCRLWRRKIMVPAYPVTCACLCDYSGPKDRGACGEASKTRTAAMRAPYIWPANGVGTILKAMLKEIGAKGTDSCGCNSLARSMNDWGAATCRERRQSIVAKLEANAKKLEWFELVKLSAKSLTASWLTAINPLDPFGSLVDEAIRRAEAMQPQS